MKINLPALCLLGGGIIILDSILVFRPQPNATKLQPSAALLQNAINANMVEINKNSQEIHSNTKLLQHIAKPTVIPVTKQVAPLITPTALPIKQTAPTAKEPAGYPHMMKRMLNTLLHMVGQ